jgi:hypothetical protein
LVPFIKFYSGDQIKDKDRAHDTHAVDTKFQSENMKRKDHLGNMVIDGSKGEKGKAVPVLN